MTLTDAYWPNFEFFVSSSPTKQGFVTCVASSLLDVAIVYRPCWGSTTMPCDRQRTMCLLSCVAALSASISRPPALTVKWWTLTAFFRVFASCSAVHSPFSRMHKFRWPRSIEYCVTNLISVQLAKLRFRNETAKNVQKDVRLQSNRATFICTYTG